MTAASADGARKFTAGGELVRHFLVRFFDNETIAFRRMAEGRSGPVRRSRVGSGHGIGDLSRPIHGLHETASVTFRQYQQAIREDLLSFIVLAMAVTALLTILQWQSLFPSLRDCLALAACR